MRPFPIIRFGYFLLVSVLGGCSGLAVEEASRDLASRAPCCNELADLSFKPLRSGEREKFELSTGSPILVFPEGRSYVAAFSLPPAAKNLSIQTLRYTELRLRRNRHSVAPGLYEHYYGIDIDLLPSAAYVVIHADLHSRRTQIAVSEAGLDWPVRPAPVGAIALIAK
jgi:hypothetical protein